MPRFFKAFRFAVAIATLSMGFCASAFALGAGSEKDTKIEGEYLFAPGDELFSIKGEKLNHLEHFMVTDGDIFASRHVITKFKEDRFATVYSEVSYDGLKLYLDLTLLPHLTNNPTIDFRVLSSLNGIGSKIGFSKDPSGFIVKQQAKAAGDSALKGLRFFLLIVLLIVAMMVIQGVSLYNTLDKHDPKDIQDSLDDLVGMDDIKSELLQLEEMILQPELYSRYGELRPFNAMLTGPAGTGKTKLARCLAKRLNVPLYYASAASLQNAYVGSGPKTLKKLYKAASKNKRAIIFLDEAEGLLESRANSGLARHDKDTATTLLSLLDGVSSGKKKNVIWIVASNFDEHKASMDDAMLRRFQLKINFRLPNHAERKEIIKRLMQNRDVKTISNDIDYEKLAAVTSGMSPALLESFVSRASLMAIKQSSIIDQELLMRAFERVAIGLTDRAATAKMEDKRRIIAIHETGHFIAQLHHTMLKINGDLSKLSTNIPTIKISTESVSKIGALGFVLSKTEEVLLDSRDELEKQIIELYSGMANEEFILGEVNTTAGAHNDISRVTRILDMMFNHVGFYSNAKINYDTLDRLGLKVGQQRLDDIKECSADLYGQSMSLMKMYEPLTYAMTDRLIADYVLNINDALELVYAFYERHPRVHAQTRIISHLNQ